jgi:hypothetical protein
MVRQEIWEWNRTWIARIQRTRDVYPRNGSLVLVSNFDPEKEIRRPGGFKQVWFFLWWINAGTYRYWTALTACVGRCGRYIRTKIGCSWWGTIWRCSKYWYTLKKGRTASTSSRHLYILQGSITSVISHLFFQPDVHTVPGNRNDSVEWQEWRIG